jgi:transporter family-2 protein
MGSKPVTWQRFWGAIIALLAVGLAASSELRGDVPVWVLVIPILAGLGVGLQQAVNGQIRSVAGSAFTATLGNFLVGAFLLAVAAVIHTAIAGWPAHVPSTPWLYLGGPVGIVFIAAQTMIVRTTGVLLMGLALLSGQLVTAVVFDLVAPVQAHGISPVTIVGACLTLLAVVIAAIPGSARPQAPSGANPSDSEFMQ